MNESVDGDYFDVADFNIRRKSGKYYDLSEDSLVYSGIQRLTSDQFLELFKRYRIRFNLTSQCNVWCVFCSNEGSSYSTKLQKNMANIEAVTKLSDILIKNTNVQSVEFSGGEPTVHPDFISRKFELIKWTKKHPEIKFAIHTNGIHLTPEVINQIQDSFFKIGISIHSPNFETWNRMTNLKTFYKPDAQKRKFKELMQNIDYLAQCDIGQKVFIKSVVIRGINDSEDELDGFLRFCADRGFHPKFFEFEPQYLEQEEYVVGRAELFAKLKRLGCRFTDDTPWHNDPESYIPSISFNYEKQEGAPKGLHSIFGCGDPGACQSCYINLPIFIKSTEDGQGLYVKPCSPLDTRFDLTWAIKNNDHKQVLDIVRMSREYLMLQPGLGVGEWNKEDDYKVNFET